MNGTTLTRRGGILCGAVAALSLASSFPGAAEASCYGSGYARFCDGIGGPSAAYSPIDRNGSTIYALPGGGMKRVTRHDASIGDLEIQIIDTQRF